MKLGIAAALPLMIGAAHAQAPAHGTSWTFQHKNTNYRVLGIQGQHQIWMAIVHARPHLILVFITPGKNKNIGDRGSVKIAFKNGPVFTFTNCYVEKREGKIFFDSGIYGKYLKLWMKEVKLLQSATVSYPKTNIKSWKIDFNGARSAVNSMISSLRINGITNIYQTFKENKKNKKPTIKNAERKRVSKYTSIDPKIPVCKKLGKNAGLGEMLKWGHCQGQRTAEIIHKNNPNLSNLQVYMMCETQLMSEGATENLAVLDCPLDHYPK